MTDPRQLQQRVKELSAAVQADPGSVARRLELAAVLRDLGRPAEAVELYQGVALLYAEEGRFAQAIAVCRGILEIDPGHPETTALLATIASKRPSRERRVGWASADFTEMPEHATPLPPPMPAPVTTPPLAEVDPEDQVTGRRKTLVPDGSDPHERPMRRTVVPTGDESQAQLAAKKITAIERPMRRTVVPSGDESQAQLAARDEVEAAESPRARRRTMVPTGDESQARGAARDEVPTAESRSQRRTMVPTGDERPMQRTPVPDGDDAIPTIKRKRPPELQRTMVPTGDEPHPRRASLPPAGPPRTDAPSLPPPAPLPGRRTVPDIDDRVTAKSMPIVVADTPVGDALATPRPETMPYPRAPRDSPPPPFEDSTRPGGDPAPPLVLGPSGEGTDPTLKPRRFEETSPDVDSAVTPPSLDEDEERLAEVLATPLPAMADRLASAPPFPLLGDLPHAAFLELAARLTVRHEPPGTFIVREGEPGDACYLVAAGAVRVLKNGLEVARLGQGSFFGEFAVLADQRRHASVEVVEEVELLEISRQLLDELTAAHPGVARTLRRFYRERLLETLVQTAPFFQSLTAAEREAVAARFRPRRFGRGARIIEEGAAGGGLYLILVGEVEVVRSDGDVEVPLASLGEGSYFGEMSLLRGGVASATVRAIRTTEAVQLPPRDFYEIASMHPVLWDALRTEAARRELLNHAILTGEARKSGDGIYLL